MNEKKLDVLAVLDRHIAECLSHLSCLRQKIADGNVVSYEKELADREAWHREAVEARDAIKELIEAGTAYFAAIDDAREPDTTAHYLARVEQAAARRRAAFDAFTQRPA